MHNLPQSYSNVGIRIKVLNRGFNLVIIYSVLPNIPGWSSMNEFKNENCRMILVNQNLCRWGVYEHCAYCKKCIKKHYWRRTLRSKWMHIIKMPNQILVTEKLHTCPPISTVDYSICRKYYSGICIKCTKNNKHRKCIKCSTILDVDLYKPKDVHCAQCTSEMLTIPPQVLTITTDQKICPTCKYYTVFCDCMNEYNAPC
jgi:hypothetical protein